LKKKFPLVSIVAINYNNSKYVIETLDSIAQQTYENIELIIVDDCSTDDSIEKIEKWLLTYNKPYKFIKHTKNKGICATINDGYRIAKGKYISSIATDDIMLPQKTEIQVQFLENTKEEVGMIFSDAYLIDEHSNPMRNTFIQKYKPDLFHFNFEITYKNLLKGNFIPAMSVMIKNKILSDTGYFDENLNYEDYDMWLRIAQKYEIFYSEFISVNYRVHKSSLSQKFSSDKWAIDDIKIYTKHRNNSPIAEYLLNNLIKESFTKNNKNVYEYLKNKKINKRITFMCKIWGLRRISHKNKVYLYNKIVTLWSYYYKLIGLLRNVYK